jgi:hypothetical protein
MKNNYYLQIQKKYGGKFIARKGAKVFAASPSLSALWKILKVKHLDDDLNIIIGYVHPNYLLSW